MSIREQAPNKKGHVLEDATSVIGGTNLMGRYDFPSFRSPVYSSRSEITRDFTRGCKRLALSLEPIQTESQFALKSAAFEYLEKIMLEDHE